MYSAITFKRQLCELSINLCGPLETLRYWLDSFSHDKSSLSDCIKVACRSLYNLTDIESPYLNFSKLIQVCRPTFRFICLRTLHGTTCQQQTHNEFTCCSILSANLLRNFQFKQDQTCTRPFSTFCQFHLSSIINARKQLSSGRLCRMSC